jgi:hypothetical protein
VGDKITVVLDAQSLHGVKALGLDVGFDPSVLKALDVNEGNAMKQGSVSANLSKTIDQTGGGITISLNGSGTASGGDVVSLTFEVIGAVEGTTVSLNSITATMEKGDTQTPIPPVPYLITTQQ